MTFPKGTIWTKTPGTEYEHAMIDVSPALATAWLDENRRHNRNISPTNVSKIAEEMATEGRWMPNPQQGIAFDSDDALIDGQHRLLAVVKTGKIIRMAVWRGLPPEFFDLIDRGVARNFRQIIQIAGYRNSAPVVETIRLVCNLENGFHRTYTPLNTSRIQSTMDTYASDLEIVYSRCKGANKTFKTSNENFLLAMFLGYLQDSDVTLDFIDQYKTGYGLKPGDPAHTLREHVFARHNSLNEVRPRQLFVRAAHSLNQRLEDKPLKLMNPSLAATGATNLIMGSEICEEFDPSFVQEYVAG
jgi:hypothetical protein